MFYLGKKLGVRCDTIRVSKKADQVFSELGTIPPLPRGEGGVRVSEQQGGRLRVWSCHMLM